MCVMRFSVLRIFLIIPCLSFLCGPLFAVCPEGDIDGDCVVGISDMLLFAEQWLDDPGCAGHPDDCADIVGNDGVDLADFVVIAGDWLEKGEPVIINEIHYNPDVATEWAEFIELHNMPKTRRESYQNRIPYYAAIKIAIMEHALGKKVGKDWCFGI